jgi:hypothetical protein
MSNDDQLSPLSSPEPKVATLSTSPNSGGGFRNFMRRLSHPSSARPEVAAMHDQSVEQLVTMGFPRNLADRQLHLSNGDVTRAAESLVHAAHPRTSSGEAFSHPECPVCVRELENIRISEARRPTIAGMLHRVRSNDADHDEPHAARRGSVSAMLRRPSISAALARMTTRDVENTH